MSVMSRIEGQFCRSALWEAFARRSVLPRVIADHCWSGTVLEVGGGAGAMADELLHTQPEIDRLVLTDVDPGMTAAARARLAHYSDRALVLDSHDGSLPVASNTLDTACAWLMLHHVVAWEAMLRDIYRALRPGGWFIGYDLTDAPLGRLLHEVSRSEHQLVRPHELRRELIASGFTDVSVNPTVLGQLMMVQARRP